MKQYSDYLKVLKKMEQIQKLLLEMDGKKISEISDKKRKQIQDICDMSEFDADSEIEDFYFIDPNAVFDLFMELDDTEALCITDDDINFAFCLSFNYRRDIIGIAHPKKAEEIIENYRADLEIIKAWEDEDKQEDENGRTYNVLVIQKSNRTYYIDSDGHHNYCWEQQETIKTNYYEKLYARVETIHVKAAFDYYPEKIFIDLDTGEEIILWDGHGFDTEPTDRATFYLKELGYDG